MFTFDCVATIRYKRFHDRPSHCSWLTEVATNGKTNIQLLKVTCKLQIFKFNEKSIVQSIFFRLLTKWFAAFVELMALRVFFTI